jgi:hypothetical protein
MIPHGPHDTQADRFLGFRRQFSSIVLHHPLL